VVSRCFQQKVCGSKITSSIFNQWIFEFKQKSSQIGLGERKAGGSGLKQFTPVVLILPPLE
jgi:hypothetical protein